jgi:mono/diheme cytochrome c family protein
MTLLKVSVFTIFVLLSYTLFANIVPQIQSDPPKDDKPANISGLDMAGMIAWGEKLFRGKGSCSLCHNDKGRAPDLLKLDLAKSLPARIADTRYKGGAKGKEGAGAIETYLRESMTKPSAYVVAGFGKVGSADSISPMPAANAPPASLNSVEINALIAFLQDKAGVKPTVPLPKSGSGAKPQAKTSGDDDDDDDDEDEDEPADTPKKAVAKFGCSACHDLFGSAAKVAPKLGGIGKRIGRAGLREAILKPNATIAKGYKPDQMPDDYGERMRVSELSLIVDYLMKLPVAAEKKKP